MEMTYERAAEILDPEHRENYDSLETVKEACRMGMDALKKRIPTRPKMIGKSKLGACPFCGEWISTPLTHKVTYCRFCGQALKWEEKENA